LDDVYILEVTIGYYTMPVTRLASGRFGGDERIEIAQTSTGLTPAYKKMMNAKVPVIFSATQTRI
jgi:hypothetical protein